MKTTRCHKCRKPVFVYDKINMVARIVSDYKIVRRNGKEQCVCMDCAEKKGD